MPSSRISVEWLTRVLDGREKVFGPDASATLLEQLLRVFHEGAADDRSDFQTAVVTALRAANPGAPSVMYNLLQLTAATKPAGSEALLDKFLASGELAHFEHPDFALEALALEVRSEFGVTDWLI